MYKAKAVYKDIDQYISTFPKDVQVVLEKIRKAIKEALPNATEGISYQIPTFSINGKYVIYFAGFQKHVSVYPVHDQASPFQKELSQYLSGRGTAKFPLNKPIPYDLIKRIAKYKAAQVGSK